jgi:hypothetical protein
MVVTVRGTKYKMKLDRTEVMVFTADWVLWSLIFAATRVILELALITKTLLRDLFLPYNKIKAGRYEC